MEGLPVIIRLLDPPLHEFLPSAEVLIEEVATLRVTAPGSKELTEKESLLAVVRDMFGTMIEIPRAALTSYELAQMAQFFSFGTNDLTQMTYGISRDDAERKFLLSYVEQEILPKNPFQTIDQDGVGRLMKFAVTEGREARPDLEVGICGEHGGEPASIEFCNSINLNYVSCSPFRVPVARLAAAHAVINEEKARFND
jgi:phosphoenolpyruvate synthase/pyruvate phosphate dikinase